MIKFVGSFSNISALPKTQFAEYAFVGRSNVGKSSLINAIVDEKIARTSNTPGRTQSMNFFNINDKTMVVDLPGYGYARVPKATALEWLSRLEEYLLNRSQLRRLFILIDSRIGPKDSDLNLMNFCDKNGICYQVVYTKKDKKIRETLQLKLSHNNHPGMMENILETSAQKKMGLDELKEIIGVK